MELWIRSQDKLILMKTTYVYVAREEVCAYDENKCWSTIGVYKSQERALEIMEEINERITLLNTLNVVKDRDTLISFKKVLGEDKVRGLGVPYQMPQE